MIVITDRRTDEQTDFIDPKLENMFGKSVKFLCYSSKYKAHSTHTE